jgi:hypothetical protein
MKTLLEIVKELYEEFPRNWRYVCCHASIFEEVKRQSVVLPKGSTLPSNLSSVDLYVDNDCPIDRFKLYNRHHEFVRDVEFSQNRSELTAS